MKSTKKIVFDSYAILKYSQNEPGADKVETLLSACQKGKQESFINQINLGEIYYKIIRCKGLGFAKNYLQNFSQLPIAIIPASQEIIMSAAELKAKHPISYSDCFVAATALLKEASVVTGDPEFKKLEHLLTVYWI
ncbi:MAG: type II toxin-antitoxin system VapC family toxin [Candidatus Schekmanbacteria bacterium]|nr:type II toxin-antitoxin system VapC family toxin [Candidatus Schekmanbacteria bacterium]